MTGLLDSVDQRTQLVGENRLEILMFNLERGQVFAINVFKIQEVQMIPKLTMLPNSHPCVVGVTHVRGKTIPVIDLGNDTTICSPDNLVLDASYPNSSYLWQNLSSLPTSAITRS